MSEPIIVKCPNCGQSLQAPPELIGTQATCSFCKKQFTVQAAPPGDQAAAPSSVPPSMGYSAGMPACVTPAMLMSLRATKPWVLFLAVLGYIGSGLMAIGGLFATIGTMAMSGHYHSSAGALPCVAGLIYLVGAVLAFIAALLLNKYSSAISRFLSTNQSADLELALAAQKSYWVYVGVLAIIYMSFMVIALLFAFGAAAMWR